jgi:hypothetical protein
MLTNITIQASTNQPFYIENPELHFEELFTDIEDDMDPQRNFIVSECSYYMD